MLYIKNDPKNTILDFKNIRVIDSSGVEAIEKLTQKYVKLGKEVTLRHLSDNCKATLKRAQANITQEEDDPNYKLARDY